MFRKFSLFFLTLLSFVWLGSGVAFAQTSTVGDSDPAATAAKLPHFAAGNQVIIDQTQNGAVFAAGGMIDVQAPVSGDLVLAGGTVRISAPVDQDVYAAGGSVIIEAPVQGNVVVAGGEIQILNAGRVDGSVIVAGENFRVMSDVAGNLIASGKSALIAGMIGHDLQFAGDTLQLEPQASVGGNLQAELVNNQVSSEASIAGSTQISENEPPQTWKAEKIFKPTFKVVSKIYTLVWKTLLIWFLLYLLPSWFKQADQLIGTRMQKTVLTGIFLFIGWPLLSLFLALTIVGFPIMMISLLWYACFLSLVWIWPVYYLGKKILPGQGEYIQAATGVLIVVLLSIIPIVGALVKLALVVLGLGVSWGLLQKARS